MTLDATKIDRNYGIYRSLLINLNVIATVGTNVPFITSTSSIESILRTGINIDISISVHTSIYTTRYS